MRRSISRWTMSLAAAGVLALPVTSLAKPQEQAAPQQQPQPAQPQPAQPQPEQPQPTQPQPAQPKPEPAQPQPAQPQPTQPQQPPTEPQPTGPTRPQPTTSAAQAAGDQTVSPQEHLRQAQQAANGISATSIPAKNRAALAELKRHLSNLEKMGSNPAASTAQPSSNAGKSASAKNANWGTEVAAVDKIITDMVGSETTSASTSTSTPGATGTTGAAKSGASSATIDEATRAKLMEVRTHITGYAAGMAGAPSTPKTDTTASSETTAATAAHTEPSMTSSPSAASPSAASPSTPAQSPSSQSPAATPSSPQTPAAGSQNTPSTQPNPNPAAQQPPAGQAQTAPGQQSSTATEQPANAGEAHKYLVEARDTLSQLTQLPAAAQLNGEARTQVAQLITNFNELIGNPPDWHVSYQKVAANLTSLLGPDNSDAEAQGGAPTNATGATATPGAVGTAGASAATVELDPAVRAKLVEFRRSLSQFEKAAGATK